MRTLDRVIAILEAVAGHPGPMSARVAASRVGLSLSTGSRLMRQLAEEGLLDRSGNNGTYVLGGRLLAIARAAREPHELLSRSLPIMETLRDTTNETVSLHIRVGDRRVCIAEVQSRLPVRRVVPLGLSVPLHFGATGEVLLAGLSPDDFQIYVAAGRQSEDDALTLTTRMDRIRREGWAVAVDAWAEGVSGLAAAIKDGESVVAVLSVSGPSSRWTLPVMMANVDAVLGAAAQISQRVGRSHRPDPLVELKAAEARD